MKGSSTMLKRKAMILAAVSFLLVFLAGAGFAVYKTNSISGVAMNEDRGINYAQKAKILETEVERNPDNTATWIQLGNVYFDTNQYVKAIDAYEKALEQNPKNC